MLALDSPCGHFLGGTNCVLPWKHDGDHEPGEVVVVDRHLQPLNRRRVQPVGKGRSVYRSRRWRRPTSFPVMFASASEYKGEAQVMLMEDAADGGDGDVQVHNVNRPAVRIGDRWVRRCPNLEVVE